MLKWVGLIALAGCGRVDFDPVDAGSVPIGHDEDGDGVPDVMDVCPHLPGTQTDTDGDGVGDDCDPNPDVPRDKIALFATMMPGDQPLEVDTATTGTWVQEADSVVLTGMPDATGYFYAGLGMNGTFGTAQIAAGFDVLQRFDGVQQNQFALGVTRETSPFPYVELNESDTWAVAQIVIFDGMNYVPRDPHDLAALIHPGAMFFQGTFVTGTRVRLDAAWPGEAYVSQTMESTYQGGDWLQINVNGLLVEIRWVCVITSA